MSRFTDEAHKAITIYRTSANRMNQRGFEYLTKLVEAFAVSGLGTSRRDMGRSWDYPITPNQTDKITVLAANIKAIAHTIPEQHLEPLRELVGMVMNKTQSVNRQEASDIIMILEKVAWYQSWPT